MEQQNTPLALNNASAYVNLASATKQQTGYFFNYDNTVVTAQAVAAAAAVAAVGCNNKQAPFSSTGNEKFDWGNELSVGALPSPNIFQPHKQTAGNAAITFTPIMTGAPYSNFAKGQNFFNFTSAAINEELGLQGQQQQPNNPQPNGFAGTPSIYENLYSANPLAHPQQYTLATTANVSSLGDNQATQFAIDHPFQFAQFTGMNHHQDSGGKNSKAGCNSTGAGSQNSPSDYLSQHAQIKLSAVSGVQTTAFPQSQFAPQQQQQQQAINSAPSGSLKQSYSGFQKSSTLLNGGNPLNNQQTSGGEQNENNLPANQSASSAPSQERRKPQLQLIQIPQDNTIHNNNGNLSNSGITNTNTILQNGNHGDPIGSSMSAPTNILNANLNTPNSQIPNTNSQFPNYFNSYGAAIGFSPFTPIQLQQLNNGPQSSRMPYQRQQNQYEQTNFFFNPQNSFQQIPESYALLTPGGGSNTGYSKQQPQQQQRFFYPNSTGDQSMQSHFPPLSAYDQNKQFQFQANTPSQHMNHQPQTLSHYHHEQQQQIQQQQQQQIQQQQQQQIQQQQQQQIQEKKENFESFKNLQDEEEPKTKEQLNDSTEKGNNHNNNHAGNGTHNEKKKKPNLNLKIDVNVNEKESEKDKVIEDEKDDQILNMLQKNNSSNELNTNQFMNDANMSLIIEFYQKANPEKKQQLFEFISNHQNEDKEDSSKYKSQKIIEYIITASTKRIGTLTLQQRIEKIQKYREKKQRRGNTSLVKYKKQQIAVSKKPRDKNGKFLKQLDEEIRAHKKIKKKL